MDIIHVVLLTRAEPFVLRLRLHREIHDWFLLHDLAIFNSEELHLYYFHQFVFVDDNRSRQSYECFLDLLDGLLVAVKAVDQLRVLV